MQKLAAMKEKIAQLPLEQQAELLDLMSELEDVENKKNAKEDFISFVNLMWPSFISGRHHKTMADAFERVAKGELKRLIINMPPRHTKSEFASFLLPAWFLGKYPHKKVIQTAHTAELAGRWNTNKRGDYFAIGVGGAVTGKGADLLIIDDPHSEQDAQQGQYNP